MRQNFTEGKGIASGVKKNLDLVIIISYWQPTKRSHLMGRAAHRVSSLSLFTNLWALVAIPEPTQQPIYPSADYGFVFSEDSADGSHDGFH